MFQNLKSKSDKSTEYKNMPTGPWPNGLHTFHLSPGATYAPIKGNEKERLVRCRICGFPCDTERDSTAKDNTWAGLGINYGAQLTAGTSIGDKRVPASGSVSKSPDKYYNRTVNAGCPCCGCYTYNL